MTKGLGVAILTLFVCAAPASVLAQQPHYGFKLGPTFSSLNADPGDEEGYETRLGAVFGGFVIVHANPTLALQLEGIVHGKGGEITASEGTTISAKLNYFEVPVLARFTPSRSATRAFYVFGGPPAAFPLSARQELSSTGGGFSSGVSDDISDLIERFEFSLVAGAGVDFAEHFLVDARYSWGLTAVNKDTSEGTLKNRAFTVLAGYRF